MARKPRPAKNLKAEDARSNYPKKGSAGKSLTVVNKPARTGNANRAKPPKVINQGHTPGSASRAVVPYKAPPSKLAAVGRTLGKVARVAGPVGLAVSMITDSRPAGVGSDKPKGPLMGGSNIRTRPSVPVGSYPKATRKPGISRNPYEGSGKAVQAAPASSATTVPKPKARPSVAPPKPKARPSMSKGPASGKMSYEPPKFSGNWTGAAPTEMQKKGGAKINRGGGLLGKLRNR